MTTFLTHFACFIGGILVAYFWNRGLKDKLAEGEQKAAEELKGRFG